LLLDRQLSRATEATSAPKVYLKLQTDLRPFKPPFWKLESEFKQNGNPECQQALGRIKFGIINQILLAFGQVASSFQFLVSSWTTIIELIFLYKWLKAFEAIINDEPLPKIDRDFVEYGSKET
jgi:hypothetical protein